jgi:hypothetical protein
MYTFYPTLKLCATETIVLRLRGHVEKFMYKFSPISSDDFMMQRRKLSIEKRILTLNKSDASSSVKSIAAYSGSSPDSFTMTLLEVAPLWDPTDSILSTTSRPSEGGDMQIRDIITESKNNGTILPHYPSLTNNLAKDNVLSIQPRSVNSANEELGALCIMGT